MFYVMNEIKKSYILDSILSAKDDKNKAKIVHKFSHFLGVEREHIFLTHAQIYLYITYKE